LNATSSVSAQEPAAPTPRNAVFASDAQPKMNVEQKDLAKRLLKEGKSVSEVARTFSVHPATLYRILSPAV
jgi:DNA invertase Pin-like site-specific DNA recombinase